MKRRRFVSGVGSGLAMIALGVGCDAEGRPAPVGAPLLAGALGDAMVRQLGRAYLAQTPAEQTVDALQRSVARAMRRAQAHWWSPTPSLERLIVSDFEQGHTIFVDGWMLSVNEARQCALATLATT